MPAAALPNRVRLKCTPVRTSQATCFIKGPAAWKRTPRKPDLTSGLVTSVTVLGFDEPLALSNNEASSLDPEQLSRAPLQGTTITGWVGGWAGRARCSSFAAAPPLGPGPAEGSYYSRGKAMHSY